jgi:hypothetical protein
MDFDFTTETITPDATGILTVGGTGALQLPSGGTAQRPTPEVGLVRLNTTGYSHGTIIEYYDTTAAGWKFMVDATNIVGVGNTVTVNNTTGEVTITGQGSGTQTFNYRADTNSQAASNPGSGNLRWNNVTLTSATQLYISGTDDNGIDQAPVFNTLSVGSVFYVQDLSLSSTFQRWTITSITNNTGWYTLGVTLISSNNFSTIPNNHRLLVALSAPLSSVTSFSAGTTGFSPSTSTVGAITLSGTLNAANGGTGNATYAVGDLLQATGATTLTRLASVATGNALISGGVTTASTWGKIGLTTHISGTLAPGNGGTGATATPTNGQLLIGNGTNFTVATLGTGTGISTTPGAGTLTINNTGVTSNVATANQTTVSGATGAVTIGLSSTLIAPGSLQVTTSTQTSATNTISAAGTNQGTGTVLTTDYNVVTTTASGTGVVLPAGLAGRTVKVVNRGANALLVYPASGAQIDALGANVAISVIVNGTLEVSAISATQWYVVTNSGAAGGVTTFSAGTTGLTPNSATAGAVTLAGTLVIANGGTNSSTALSGSSIMISNGTSIIQGAAGTTTTVLHGNAAGAPTYSAVSLTADVSGVLPLANGGTNANLTAVNGGSVYSTATGFAITAAGTTGQVLVSAGAAAPVWTNTAGILQLYKENPSAPTAPTVAGTNAVAIGSGSAAPGNNAIAIGAGTSATNNNTLVIGNGNFATAGDAQELTILSRNTTTNATPTQLFVNGSAQQLVLPNNSAWTFFIKIVGRRTDATGGYAMYTITGGITRDATAATTTLRANTRTVIAESAAAMDAAVTADTTNGSLNITVTGIAAQTIRWVATSQITQVTN